MAIKQEMAAPHIRRKRTTSAIMADVVIALLPVCAWAVWLFRWQAAAVLATTTAVCSLADWVCLKLRGRGGFDGSAAVTGLLLGLSLPAGTALWAAALAGVFAVAVVKQLPGGIGHNLFNPAMAGRALLLVALPQTLGGYVRPDAVSSATPIAEAGLDASLWPLFFGYENGSMGETSALLILIGMVYLCLRGVIRMRVPVTCVWSFALVYWIFGGTTPFTGAAAAQLLSGGLLLGAVFMVTDFTSKPTTPVGECLFAAGVGILTAVLRLWGPYPEGVCFAILLMNAAAPLIEWLTMPRVYGVRIGRHAA